MFHHVLTTDFHLDLTRLMGSPLTKSPLLKNTFKTIFPRIQRLTMSGHGKELREELWWRDKEEGRERADLSQNLLQYPSVCHGIFQVQC